MLYLVRHGQTTYGAEGKFQGCKEDVPLTELGQAQAWRLRQVLPEHLTIFSSPLLRCRTTASAIRGGYAVHDDLRDIDVGPLGGWTLEGARKLYPEFYRHYIRHQPYEFPDGEKLEETFSRVGNALSWLPKDVIVVAHYHILNFMICKYLGLDWWRFPSFEISECSVSIVEQAFVGDPWSRRLVQLNCTTHLAGL